MKKTFLKWWLMNLVVIISCLIATYFGVLKEIYNKDYSYLCFAILIIYVVCSLLNGITAFNIDENKKIDSKKIELSWFMSEMCLALGMIGTVIGFIGMLQGFGLSTEGTKAIQKLLSNMSYGMATALYTTLCGLIFGNLLKLQCFDLEKAIEGKKENV